MADTFEILKRFDELPDDAIVSNKITAIVLSLSERTVRRHPPVPPIRTSPGKRGSRVGDLRKLIRSGNPQLA
jgi:hypothetical protein